MSGFAPGCAGYRRSTLLEGPLMASTTAVERTTPVDPPDADPTPNVSDVRTSAPVDPIEHRPSVAVFAPALVLVIEIHEKAGTDDVHLHAGGQGYWVCRMIDALGAEALPCAPVGGEPGVALDAIVRADGFDAGHVLTSAPNSVILDDRRSGRRHEIVATEVPTLGRHEIDELYSTVIGRSMRAGVCVIAGAHLAPAIPDDTYRRLVSDLRSNGVFVIADLSGAQLEAALSGGIDMIKVSHEELRRGGWSRSDSVRGVADGIAKLRLAGAGSVVVSRCDRSTVCSLDDRLLEVRPPALEVVDGRGGGDSMTAALAVGVARGWSLDDAIRLAAAAGSLNVSRHGLGTGRRDTIEALASKVELREVLGLSNAGGLEHATRDQLYDLARRRGIIGRSAMRRDELLVALSAGEGARVARRS